MTFKFTQLLFLADRDIVYSIKTHHTHTLILLIILLENRHSSK